MKQQPGLRFLNDFKRLDVGFAFKKGTPLAPAVRAAVNRLKKAGTYGRILKKWGTGPSAIETSRISRPEIRRAGVRGAAAPSHGPHRHHDPGIRRNVA